MKIKKLSMTQAILGLITIQALIIAASFGGHAHASIVHSGNEWTLNQTLAQSIKQVEYKFSNGPWNVNHSVSQVSAMLADFGLVYGKGYRADTGNKAALATKKLGSYHNNGFWGLAKGTNGRIYMVDVILKGNTYQWVNNLVSWNSDFSKPGTTVFVKRGWKAPKPPVVIPPVVIPPVVRPPVTPVPVPAAVWLFGTGIAALVARKKLGGSK